MTTLYLIRHGATKQNEARPIVLQGCGIDGPLSDKGHTQAAKLGRILSSKPLTHVYASPMHRAQQTAAAVAEPHGLTVQTVDELHEVDVGDWEGRSWTEVMEQEPDAYARFIADPGTVPYRGGESYGDVLRRAKPPLLDLLSQHDGESIAVVAHNVVNRALLADLLTLPLKQAKDIRQGNCCINIIRRKEESIELLTLNAELTLFDEVGVVGATA